MSADLSEPWKRRERLTGHHNCEVVVVIKKRRFRLSTCIGIFGVICAISIIIGVSIISLANGDKEEMAQLRKLPVTQVGLGIGEPILGVVKQKLGSKWNDFEQSNIMDRIYELNPDLDRTTMRLTGKDNFLAVPYCPKR